jgi:hypothetical protein
MEFHHTQHEDFVGWWIARQEGRLGVLIERTQRVIDVAYVLRRASRDLKSTRIRDLPCLARELNEFAREFSNEIAAVLDFVRWLSIDHPRRPCILFAYSVWGATSRNDRRGGKLGETLRSHSDRELTGWSINSICKFALDRDVLTWVRDPDEGRKADALHHYPADLQNREEPDYLCEDECLRAVDAFAEYWDDIWRSMDRIMERGEACERQAGLVRDGAFWDRFLSKAILRHPPPFEPRLWDVKETLELFSTHGRVKEEKSAQFAERVVTFANCDGGVILIGVSDGPIRLAKGVEKPAERVAHLEELIHRLTNLPPSTYHVVPFAHVSGGSTVHCIAVVIAQTKDPAWARLVTGVPSFATRGFGTTVKSDVARVRQDKHRREVGMDNFDFVHEVERLSR